VFQVQMERLQPPAVSTNNILLIAQYPSFIKKFPVRNWDDKFTIMELFLFIPISFEFFPSFNILRGISDLVKANFLGSPAG